MTCMTLRERLVALLLLSLPYLPISHLYYLVLILIQYCARIMTEIDGSADLASRGIFSLPDEILLLILTQIPPSSVLSLSVVSRRFYYVTLSPKLWRHYCQTTFTHWDKRHEFDSKTDDRTFSGWKALFAARHASSAVTLRAFNSMLDSDTNRFDHIHTILSVGYDAKDVLLNAYENARGEDRHLAQRLLFSLMIRNLH